MPNMYSPLPECVEIRPSPVHGKGLFATKPISKGTNLGVSHVRHADFQDGWIRTPLGGFYNHSDTPNCILYDKYKAGTNWDYGTQTHVRHLYTLIDIESDQELTCTYTLWNPSGMFS